MGICKHSSTEGEVRQRTVRGSRRFMKDRNVRTGVKKDIRNNLILSALHLY